MQILRTLIKSKITEIIFKKRASLATIYMETVISDD